MPGRPRLRLDPPSLPILGGTVRVSFRTTTEGIPSSRCVHSQRADVSSVPSMKGRPAQPSEFASGLLRAKVLPPELPVAHVTRTELLRRLEGMLERRVTVLEAPAGFGKTVVLTEIARTRAKQGKVAAWISLNDEDTPSLFGRYLAFAFEQAGLDLDLLRPHDAWSASPTVQQMGMLAGAVEAHTAPCLLVLDEVDRLPPRTVRLVDLLLQHAPRNLCVAMAFRSNPGVNVGKHVLSGGASVISAEELRVSRIEIVRFLGRELLRGELAKIEERTAGWPVALRVYRNTGAAEPAGGSGEAESLTDNYMGLNLLRDLSDAQRLGLFDLAVFDRIDASLVDAVLGSSDTRRLIAGLPVLNGLLLPVDGDGGVTRLHPLLRHYCLATLSVENPVRKRSLHKEIALELARRGQLTESWRHARAAGESEVLGQLIERSGPFQLWLREGAAQLISAGRFLDPEVTVRYPRLCLLRCVVLCLVSQWSEAALLFEEVSQRTDGFTRDRDGGDADALAVDGVFTQAVLAGGADRLLSHELAAQLPPGKPAAADERGRKLHCARHTMLAIACYERADFDEGARHSREARAYYGKTGRFGEVFLNACAGMAAMAQGRVREAAERYRHVRRVARRSFSADPCITASSDVLTIELDLERNRARAIRRKTLERLTQPPGVWADLYLTATAVSAELMLEQYGNRAAIHLLKRADDAGRTTGNESLSSALSALLAHYLVEAGQGEEAGAVWRDRELPCGAAELLDIERRSWRTMETLACARVRLLEAQGDFDGAETLAVSLCDVARERGLARTLLRGLALSMAVAHAAGRPDHALERLVEFIHTARGADYIRPLVRRREVSRIVLRRLLDADCDADLRPVAERLLAETAGPDTGSPFFSTREVEVLAQVARGRRNKEIAARLGLTDQGVRYHLKSIYRKTGTNKRTEAARYAQSIGALS